MRLEDNASLCAAAEAGLVQPVFVFDPTILAQFTRKDDPRISFLVARLQLLHAELKKKGGGLLVLHADPQDAIPNLAKALKTQRVCAAEDHEKDTRARDEAVSKILQAHGCELQLTADTYLMHPASKSLRNKSGAPYKVYSAFRRQWRASLPEHALEAITCKPRFADFATSCKAVKNRLDLDDDLASLVKKLGYQPAKHPNWPVDGGEKRLAAFAKDGMKHYETGRNKMGVDGTSRLSPYLRFGLISCRAAARAAQQAEGGTAGSWMNELIWREFYFMVMWHFPQTESQDFVAYKNLTWKHRQAALQRWKDGQTGFPVVDAAMRQLKEIGWMHNRARMIVASFLTKNLLIDWREGEEHFAQYLMDYERSSNVGGWQWSASTGTDAQPYFRVFNPVTQGETHDPKGEYIRRYVPELAGLDAKTIHQPWKSKQKLDYPAPMLDLSATRAEAIAHFRAAR